MTARINHATTKHAGRKFDLMFNTRPQTPVVFPVVTAQWLVAIRAAWSKSCFMASRMVNKTVILDIRTFENVPPANRTHKMKRVIVAAAGLYIGTADFTSTMCADNRPRIRYGHSNTGCCLRPKPELIIFAGQCPASTIRSLNLRHRNLSMTRTLPNELE